MLNVAWLTTVGKRMATLLSVPQLASRLAMSRHHVWRLCREGDLPHTRINGRTIRFDAEEIDAWIARGKQPLKKQEEAQ
jgi:excisionase family DNA binding protein